MPSSIMFHSRQKGADTHSVPPPPIEPALHTSLSQPAPRTLAPSPKLTDHRDTIDPGIRVLLVDDYPMIRLALRSVLEAYDDVTIVAEAADGAAALSAVSQYRPEVVVMDISMPGMNGFETTAVIKALYPTIQIIGLSVHAEQENQRLMSAAGGRLLLDKELAVDQLYEAIREAAGDSE